MAITLKGFKMIDFKQLVKAGVHFGHRTSVWCPKMQPYIWGHKNNVHLIDVSKTAFQLEKAAQFLEGVASDGKSILWIGTKKAAQDSVRSAAERLNMPYVNHRWIGGTLSNYPQVKKSVTKLLHYEDVIAKDSNSTFYTKKELNKFRKSIDRLKTNIGGIINLRWPLGAVVLVDVNKESSALREAASMRIPVVALVDTNSDPSLVNYVVPGNDDAPRSVKLIIDYLEEAARRGQEVAKTKGEAAAEDHEEEEALLATLPEEEGEEEANGRKGPRKTTDNGKKFNRKDETGAEGAAKHRPVARPRVVYNAPKKANNKPS
jgi:small subunit ribosomal protein S2